MIALLDPRGDEDNTKALMVRSTHSPLGCAPMSPPAPTSYDPDATANQTTFAVYSSGKYTLVRAWGGLGLVAHFGGRAAEMSGSAMIIPALLALLACGVAAGWRRVALTRALTLGWLLLVVRDPARYTGELPWIVPLLLAMIIVPEGEPGRWRARPNPHAAPWRMPPEARWGVALATGLLGALQLMGFGTTSTPTAVGVVAPLLLFLFPANWIRPTRSARDTEPGHEPLLLYDGECGLCNAVILFLIREDTSARLRFAPLHGAVGQAALRRAGLLATDFDSLVFFPDRGAATYFLRSDGALRLALRLGGIWRGLAVLALMIPRRWRDVVYRGVARFRYRVFGTHKPAPLPDATWASRFIE